MFENKRYNSANVYFKKIFNQRVQKIAIDAGFTCPNRDKTKSVGGCTYCNNITFKPFYCNPEKSINQQINEGISFFSKKYASIKFIAYFQAYTNTYASLDILKKLYNEALSNPDIVGLVISTRPDCVDYEKLEFIAELSKTKYVSIEYGIESTNDETLKKINRASTFDDAKQAIEMTANKGINVGAHLILGLPEETEEMILEHAIKISELKINTLKMHQLQIIKNTKMAYEYEKKVFDFKLFNIDEYVNLVVAFVERLNPNIMIERFSSESPLDLLIAPNWGGLKNYEIVHKIEKRLEKLNTWQGKFYDK